MIRLTIILLLALTISCTGQNSKVINVDSDNFITSPGEYRLKTLKLKLVELENGTLIFGIADKFNNVIFQNSLFSTFSKFQEWIIYIDKSENIWFYNADLQEPVVIIKDIKTQKYVVKNYIDEEMETPKAFQSKLNH